MTQIRIRIIDEVNAYVEGLTEDELEYLRDRTKYYVKGHYMDAMFKTGNWDGRESLIQQGLNFQYMLPRMMELLIDDLGVPDSAIQITDEREFSDLVLPDHPVDEHFVHDEFGFPLRDIQLEALNSVFQHRKGLLDMAPNAGKSAICLSISKYYDGHLPTLVAVPNTTLVKQMKADYEKSGLNFKAFLKVPTDKRESIFEGVPHIILTHKLLLNVLDLVDDVPYVLMYDESHLFGDVMAAAFRDQLRNCPVRVGLSGSFPKKDKFKVETIKAHMGGDVLCHVKSKELEEKGYSSKAEISLIITKDSKLDPLSNEPNQPGRPNMWDWDTEKEYIQEHPGRIQEITRFIQQVQAEDPKNSLLLCHPSQARAFAGFFGGEFIVDETKDDKRQEYLANFDICTDYILPATFGTVGTGISKNSIRRVFFIDIGKVDHWIIQGIGRGVRLDGDENVCEFIDISADTKYSRRHRGTRISMYKEQGHEHHIASKEIIVQ